MRVFLVDKTVNQNVVYSQLIIPLKLLNDQNSILLLPKKMSQNINLANVKVLSYKNFFSKYGKILAISCMEDVYTRSVIEFVYLYIIRMLFMKRWTITYDFRGLVYAEYGLRHKHLVRYYILKYLELFASKKADHLRTVSWAFANFLKQEFATNKTIRVIPCCIYKVNYIVKQERSKCLSFVFVGSFAGWLKIDHILDVYRLIAMKINSKLTIITNEVTKAECLLREKNILAQVISLPQHEVEKELWKYDFGFLLRDNINVNNVASPIKFLEYVGNGVIPIISEGIGDYSSLVKEKNIGVLESNDIDSMITKMLELRLREDIQEQLYNIASEYTWNNYLKIF